MTHRYRAFVVVRCINSAIMAKERSLCNFKRKDEREENPQMKPTSEILERMKRNSGEHPEGVYTRLYRYLLREDIYMTA